MTDEELKEAYNNVLVCIRKDDYGTGVGGYKLTVFKQDLCIFYEMNSRLVAAICDSFEWFNLVSLQDALDHFHKIAEIVCLALREQKDAR